MGLESIISVMEIFMRVCGLKTKDMVRGFITIKMVKFIGVCMC